MMLLSIFIGKQTAAPKKMQYTLTLSGEEENVKS